MTQLAEAIEQRLRERFPFILRDLPLATIAEAVADVAETETERYRQAWLSRGRRINGVGEFLRDGPWEPVAKVQNRMLHGVIEALEDGYHPQNPSPLHPADFVRQRYPHLLREDEAVAFDEKKEGPRV